jgi:hypothetical protein
MVLIADLLTLYHPVPYPFLPPDNVGARGIIYVAATGFAYLAFKGLNGLHR